VAHTLLKAKSFADLLKKIKEEGWGVCHREIRGSVQKVAIRVANASKATKSAWRETTVSGGESAVGKKKNRRLVYKKRTVPPGRKSAVRGRIVLESGAAIQNV